MLNQTQRLYKSKSKSKIFLIILCIFGLLFSWSCSCRNRVTGPGNDGLENGKITNNITPPPPDTFSPRLDLGNSYNVSFTSDGTEKLHASVKFTEPNKYGYKAEITEVTDGETVLTTDNIQYNEDGTFKIEQATLQALAGKLDSTDKPATNEVSITFKLTSTDTNLNNNTTNITQTFNFIKALNIDENNLQTHLHKYTAVSWGDLDNEVKFEKGEYRDGIYTLTSSIKGSYGADKEVLVSECKTKFINRFNGKYYGTPAEYNPYFKVSDDNKTVTDTSDTVSFSVNLEFTDIAESKLTSLSVKFVKGANQDWVFKK